MTAEGRLEGAPLALAAQATRDAGGTLHLDISRADWRSTHADGKLELPPGATLPLGTLTVKLGDLGEFSRLAGQRLAGAIDAVLRTEQQGGVPVAVLDLKAPGNAGLPGQASVGEATLTARVRDPAGKPVTEARLNVAGSVGEHRRRPAAGRHRTAGRAGPGAVGHSDRVSGADLSVQTSATLDAPGRTLGVRNLQAGLKGETLRLLAPARLSFATGWRWTGCGWACATPVLDVAGRVGPTLDLTASLRNVTADLARIVAPDLQADGNWKPTRNSPARQRARPARPGWPRPACACAPARPPACPRPR